MHIKAVFIRLGSHVMLNDLIFLFPICGTYVIAHLLLFAMEVEDFNGFY